MLGLPMADLLVVLASRLSTIWILTRMLVLVLRAFKTVVTDSAKTTGGSHPGAHASGFRRDDSEISHTSNCTIPIFHDRKPSAGHFEGVIDLVDCRNID